MSIPEIPKPRSVVGPILLPLKGRTSHAIFHLWYYEFEDCRWIAAKTGKYEDNPFPIRIESACVFGHVFHSGQCDCEYQWEKAIDSFVVGGRGLLIYGVDQDARGLGIRDHFRIYRMRQYENLDTPTVYKRLKAPVDARTYEPVVTILRDLGLGNLLLLSNNPRRKKLLLDHGFRVETVSLEAPLDEHNMATMMLEKEDLGYSWSFNTHGDWLKPMQEKVDGELEKQVASVVANTQNLVAEVTVEKDWQVARSLWTALGQQKLDTSYIVYLTDLPRFDELPVYAEMGVFFVVVPFPVIPAPLQARAESLGMKIQDWGRENKYKNPRLQWTFLGDRDGCHFYRRDRALRLVQVEDTAQGLFDQFVSSSRKATLLLNREAGSAFMEGPCRWFQDRVYVSAEVARLREHGFSFFGVDDLFIPLYER